MADLPRPVTRMTWAAPAFTASSTISWMVGVSTIGSISFGTVLVTGRKRVPSPAAGLAQVRRYHFEVDGMYDSRFPAQAILASLVDSASAPIASGLLWSRWASGQPSGRGEGWSLGLGYSGAIGQGLFLGGETKYLRYHTPDGLGKKWAQDAGVLGHRGNFAWAAVVQNISTDKISTFPLTAVGALAWGTDTDWHLAFDYRADLSDS